MGRHPRQPVPRARARPSASAWTRIVGLIPGIGDLASPAYTALILVEALRLRVPAVVQARMVLNAAIDMTIGLVPLLGDIADVAWKANLRNLALLERHARPGTPPSPGDYLFVAVCLAAGRLHRASSRCCSSSGCCRGFRWCNAAGSGCGALA